MQSERREDRRDREGREKTGRQKTEGKFTGTFSLRCVDGKSRDAMPVPSGRPDERSCPEANRESRPGALLLGASVRRAWEGGTLRVVSGRRSQDDLHGPLRVRCKDRHRNAGTDRRVRGRDRCGRETKGCVLRHGTFVVAHAKVPRQEAVFRSAGRKRFSVSA